MLNNRLCSVYGTVLLSDLILTALQLNSYRFFTKPLLTVLLAIYTVSALQKVPAGFKALLLMALFFSFSGDVLLLLEDQSPSFFLFGLGAFLMAHLAYIGYFLRIRYNYFPLPLCKFPLIFLTAAVAISFILFMAPHLAQLLIPVIVYTVAICFTLLTTLHAFQLKLYPVARYCVAGALLFICSDAMIAINKFYAPLPAAGVWIMLTYGLAQWGLVYGSTRFLATTWHSRQLTTVPH